MSFTEAVRTVLSKYATFSGRAGRPEYWWWTLFVILLTIGTAMIDHLVLAPQMGYPAFSEDTPELLSLVVSLGLFLPGIAVSARRLHDLDRTGWWLLILVIPLIGWLLLLFWFVQRGTEGPNRFGPPATRDAGI